MENSKRKPPAAGKGRPKGSPNKVTSLLKDSILQAAEEAGDGEGMVGYLKKQAIENPGPFMTLLGKVLPAQVDAQVDSKLEVADPLKALLDDIAARNKSILDMKKTDQESI